MEALVIDLTSAFHQIPLSRDSTKYSGVVKPFRGVQVYARSAGEHARFWNGSKRTYQYVPRSRSLIGREYHCPNRWWPLLQRKQPARTLTELAKRVTSTMHKYNLRLSPSKTIINPHSTTVVGWVLNFLSTCSPRSPRRPRARHGGSNEIIYRCIQGALTCYPGRFCTSHHTNYTMLSLNEIERTHPVDWRPNCFIPLSTSSPLTTSHHYITRPDDQLSIVTYGAVRIPDIGATLNLSRAGKLHLAGF